jgi:hypothetical protein
MKALLEQMVRQPMPGPIQLSLRRARQGRLPPEPANGSCLSYRSFTPPAQDVAWRPPLYEDPMPFGRIVLRNKATLASVRGEHGRVTRALRHVYQRAGTGTPEVPQDNARPELLKFCRASGRLSLNRSPRTPGEVAETERNDSRRPRQDPHPAA